jgi:ATP-dependent DNA ligase
MDGNRGRALRRSLVWRWLEAASYPQRRHEHGARMTGFKPMLACKADPAKLRFPLYVQPKLDGIRASVVDGKLLTRTLKRVPNREIFSSLSRPEFEGLDGELIVGDPTADDCYRRTSSFVMSESKTGEPWVYYVFDKHDHGGTFAERYQALVKAIDLDEFGGVIQIVPTLTAQDAGELEAIEAVLVDDGHEGAILRQPHSRYKFGRASKTAGELVKLKRFEDAEAEIIGVYEEQHNGNVAVRNALGRTERSTAQAGKVGKGTLGGFYVRDLETGIEFKVGTGFSADERLNFWIDQHDLIGLTVKYKSFKIGVKEKPRHPVFLGFRDRKDM